MNYEYHDALLKSRVTAEIEDEAIDYISELGELPDSWKARLTISHVYVIAATRHQTQAGDAYSEKAKTYTEQFKYQLKEARIAQEKIDLVASPARERGSWGTREIEIG